MGIYSRYSPLWHIHYICGDSLTKPPSSNTSGSLNKAMRKELSTARAEDYFHDNVFMRIPSFPANEAERKGSYRVRMDAFLKDVEAQLRTQSHQHGQK